MKTTSLKSCMTAFVLLFGLFYLSGCTCDKNKLFNQTWVLDKYGPRSAPKAVLPTPPEVTLKVDPANHYSGSDGCNTYFGACVVGDDCAIKFDTAANTLIFCNGPGVMQQAAEVKDLLVKTTEYCVTDTELELCAPGKLVMKFHKK